MGAPGDEPWHDGSFRDPSGRVLVHHGRVLRALHRTYQQHYDALISSGLHARLVSEHLLIPHREVDPRGVAMPADFALHRLLEPEPIAFVSHPHEWCFTALADAALATLRVQRLAIEHGMTLKDASAFNVQWHHGSPLLIDTSSFEIMPLPRPWPAYRQFCRHFLAPLALMGDVDPRLSGLWLANLDGIPLDLASRLLPRRTWLRPGPLLHVHLHARGERRFARSPGVTPTPRSPRTMSRDALLAFVSSLENAVHGRHNPPARTSWSAYGDAPPSYSADASLAKAAAVDRIVRELRPRVVWDLGANTGALSRVAARAGATKVIAFEQDHASVDRCYRELRDAGETSVLPLVSDVTNPSPAFGWAGRERASLTQRGPCDLALALALVHHLAIANHMPFPRIASWLAEVAKVLLIEWVPRSDEMVQHLLADREGVFADYDEAAFAAAFVPRFELLERLPIRDSDRVLYLYQRR